MSSIQSCPETRTDFFAEWFSALEDSGECLLFRMGRCADANARPEWHFLPHQSYDGIGGLKRLLSDHYGSTLELPRLAAPYPSYWRRLIAAVRFLLRGRREPMRFRSFEDDWRGKPRNPTQPTAYAWALLGERETRVLRDTARSNGVSLNAWLLWSLTQPLLGHLDRDGGDVQWIVPINMRGTRPDLPETANQAATLDVAFPASASPVEVDRAIRKERETLAHFGVWELLRILERLKGQTIRRLALRESAVRKHGSFSNLGNLGLSGSELRNPGSEFWMAFNPVLKSRPIGAACLTYQGRMTLTLQLHPALSRDAAVAQTWLREWLEVLLRSTEQHLPQIHTG